MRRKERQITDEKKLAQIIEACHCIRVGFSCEGQIYIVPVNFGYIFENGGYTFYFHSAKEGRKIELIMRSPAVGFEMDTGYGLKTSASACGHSAYFQSIIGQGRVSIVEDWEEKKKGLQAVMEHETGRREWEFQEKMLDAVCVWKLEVREFTGKENTQSLISKN